MQAMSVKLRPEKYFLEKGDDVVTNHMRYVIIGGSAAGMSAAGVIRELDSKGSITVFSDEPDMPYFRPLIPFLISGQKSPSDLALMGQGPYTGTGIDVRLKSRVETVNAAEQTVSIQGGEQVPYDRLLIATGSRPIIPSDLGGVEIEGVFTLRTLTNAREIAQRAESTRQVVMLGGGMLNTKAAFALLELDLEVTMVELEAEVLPWLMEPDAAVLIRDALTRAGLKVITGCTASRILSDSHGVSGVLLNNGQELPCQMFCIGVGVTPNVDFLDQSGIQVDQGVVVDRFTACKVRNIFAAGDVASTFDSITGERIVTGLWTNAVDMGRCAGRNMAGQPSVYAGTFGIFNATQVADVPFVSMGIVHTEGTDYETHVMSKSKYYRKLVFTPDGNRLVGALFVGDISNAGLYRYVIREGMAIDKIKSSIINHQLHYGHFLRQ